MRIERQQHATPSERSLDDSAGDSGRGPTRLFLPTTAGREAARPLRASEGERVAVGAKPMTSVAAMARAMPARMLRENIPLS